MTVQLVDEGRLRLNDTVEQWLPGMVPKGAAITIRMLLNHQRNLRFYRGRGWSASVLANPHRYWLPQELVAVGTAHPPTFPLGRA